MNNPLEGYGYFADPVTKEPVRGFKTLKVECLEGSEIFIPLPFSLTVAVASWAIVGASSLGVLCPRYTAVIQTVGTVLAIWATTSLVVLKAWWIKVPNYRLLEPLLFVDRNGKEWRVKEGTIFNGLSVPWWAWWVCPPCHPDAIAASALHDDVYDRHHTDSIEGALLFWLAMRANGMYSWGAFRNWLAVRYCGPQFDKERQKEN